MGMRKSSTGAFASSASVSLLGLFEPEAVTVDGRDVRPMDETIDESNDARGVWEDLDLTEVTELGRCSLHWSSYQKAAASSSARASGRIR